MQDYVDTAFKKLFFNVPQNEKPEYNGVQLINSAVIARYLKQLLQNDLFEQSLPDHDVFPSQEYES